MNILRFDPTAKPAPKPAKGRNALLAIAAANALAEQDAFRRAALASWSPRKKSAGRCS